MFSLPHFSKAVKLAGAASNLFLIELQVMLSLEQYFKMEPWLVKVAIQLSDYGTRKQVYQHLQVYH